MKNKYFNLIILLVLFLSNCKDNKNIPKNTTAKKTSINVLTQFSINYNQDLVGDSNNFIYYVSKSFDTSFVVQVVKQDSLYNGVCYFVPSINKKGIADDSLNSTFLFSGFHFILNAHMWEDMQIKYQNLNLAFEKSVCLDCSFMFASTNGNIKSGNIREDNAFNSFIINEVIHPNLNLAAATIKYPGKH